MFHLAPVLGSDGKAQLFLGVQVDVTARDDVSDETLAQSSKLAGDAVLSGTISAVSAAGSPWGQLRSGACAPKPHRRMDPKWQAIRAVMAHKRGPLDADDFAVIRKVGRGDVGNVHLVRLKGTRALFAMKVLEKQEMIDRNKLHRVKTEDEILSSVDHPFLATLFTSFQSPTALSFIMDFCPGGELFELMQKQPRKRFTEDATRFYAAEVLLALQYLHLLGFVYRDLKPENVLLHASGHVLLTDFDLSFCGSSKPTVESSKTVAGTPEHRPMLVRLPPPNVPKCAPNLTTPPGC